MLIAREGCFGVMNSVYLCPHNYTTHDINIVKFETNFEDEIEYNYVIASFDDSGNLVSVEDRLIDAIEDSDDAYRLKKIIKVARSIIETETYRIDRKE